jgi:hypothetical protein
MPPDFLFNVHIQVLDIFLDLFQQEDKKAHHHFNILKRMLVFHIAINNNNIHANIFFSIRIS